MLDVDGCAKAIASLACASHFSAEEMYITILIEYATLALPIQNTLMHAVMYVVQVKLFTAYY